MSETNVISVKELMDILECPVCLSLPRTSPVFQCPKGHVVCNKCHPKLNICPICRSHMGNNRSLIADRMLAKCPMPCCFSNNGCAVVLVKEKLSEHEAECPFRMVPCIDLDCSDMIPLNHLLKHLGDEHEMKSLTDGSKDKSSHSSYFIVHDDSFTEETSWVTDHLVLDSMHFFRECYRSSNGLWYLWVYMLGSVGQTKHFSYTITLSTENKDDELRFQARVVPIDIDKDDLPTKAAALIIPDSVVRSFCENKKVWYSVKVQRNPAQRGAADCQGQASVDQPDDTDGLQSQGQDVKKEEDVSVTTNSTGLVDDEAIKL